MPHAVFELGNGTDSHPRGHRSWELQIRVRFGLSPPPSPAHRGRLVPPALQQSSSARCPVSENTLVPWLLDDRSAGCRPYECTTLAEGFDVFDQGGQAATPCRR